MAPAVPASVRWNRASTHQPFAFAPRTSSTGAGAGAGAVRSKLGYGAESKHTVPLDADGNAWSSANPWARLDRKTKKFTRFDQPVSTDDVEVDGSGNIWFNRPDTS